MIRQILAMPEIGFEPELSDEKEEIRDLITEIGNVKNRGISIENYESNPLRRSIYQNLQDL